MKWTFRWQLGKLAVANAANVMTGGLRALLILKATNHRYPKA
jgi:hypothetical protein